MVIASLFLSLLPLAWAGNLEPPDKPFKLQNVATSMYLLPVHGNQHENNADLVYYGGSGGDNEFIAEKKKDCFASEVLLTKIMLSFQVGVLLATMPTWSGMETVLI